MLWFRERLKETHGDCGQGEGSSPGALTVFVIEDADRQRGLQILQLDAFSPFPCPPKVKGRLSYEVPACIAEFAKETKIKITR